MVEVLQRCSRLQGVDNRLCKALTYARSVTADAPTLEAKPSQAHKLSQRLTPEVIEQIIADHAAGSSTRKLGLKYDLHRNSVTRLLQAEGVTRPRTRITDEHVEQAKNLFNEGLSVAKAAQQLGIAPTTMTRAFQVRGLPTSHG
jgi:AraC-like DNA-binding protein